jgi:hypothetical protein
MAYALGRRVRDCTATRFAEARGFSNIILEGHGWQFSSFVIRVFVETRFQSKIIITRSGGTMNIVRLYSGSDGKSH